MIQGSSNNNLSSNALKDIKHEQMKVKAVEFVDKLKSLDEISNKSNSAKSKLMELRYASRNKQNISTPENDFDIIIKNKNYSIKVKGILEKEFYIFSPIKISNSLDEMIIPQFISSHLIIDSPTNITLKKIADLQEYLNTDITGYIDEKFFYHLIEVYNQSIFTGNIYKIELLDKLITNISFLLGTEIKIGAYLKALIVIKTIILAGENNHFGNFDKMNKFIDNNLPEIVKTKFKIKLAFLKKRYISFSKQDTDNGNKINQFIEEEKINMSIYDKLNFFNQVIKYNSFKYINLNYIIDILDSIMGHRLNEDQKDIILRIGDLLFKSPKSKIQLERFQSIYNKIRFHYID